MTDTVYISWPAGPKASGIAFRVPEMARTAYVPESHAREWAETNATLAAEITRLRGVMQAVVDGDYPMPVAQAFRSDGAWSKHDRCAHGNRISDGCENCVDVFLTAALGEQP